MINDHPFFGVGLGTFMANFSKYIPHSLAVREAYAHNCYLQMAAEMGVVAPFIMLWLFAAIIWRGLKDAGADAVKLGCAIGILSLSLHGLIDFNFHIPANMLLFTVYAAIVMSPSHGGEEGR